MSAAAVVIGMAASLASTPPPATPVWGPDGHMVVCQIAFERLDSAEQAEVTRLTAAYRRPDRPDRWRYTSFAEACTFADDARTESREEARRAASGANFTPRWAFFSRFNQWHYLNVPRYTRTVTEEDCGRNCVLQGIEHHAGRLSNDGLEDWKRAEALFFLGHWVGDLHQPLHISFADDTGGNDVPIRGIYGTGERRHLHYVWDTGILRGSLRGRTWQAYARDLANGISAGDAAAWQGSSPIAWAQESYELTTQAAVDYCEWAADPDGGSDLCRPEPGPRNLGVAYQTEFQDDVELRLRQAGVRLAALIERALQ